VNIRGAPRCCAAICLLGDGIVEVGCNWPEFNRKAWAGAVAAFRLAWLAGQRCGAPIPLTFRTSRNGVGKPDLVCALPITTGDRTSRPAGAFKQLAPLNSIKGISPYDNHFLED